MVVAGGWWVFDEVMISEGWSRRTASTGKSETLD
jgi:hypothetical protein